MSTPIADWAGSDAELSRWLLENVRDYAVFALDAEGAVCSWSPSAEQLLGYRAPEVVGEPAERFYTREDCAAGVPAQERRQALATGRAEAQRWHVCKDASRFWSTDVTIPRRGPEGTLLGFVTVMRERSDLKRCEDARAEVEHLLETRFASLVKNVKDHAIFTLDPDGRVTSWNIAAEQVLGYPEAEVIGQHFELLFTPEDRQQGWPEAELRAARAQGSAEDARWHQRKDGKRFWAEGILSALYDPDRRLSGFAKILRDMTAWKRTEQALRASEERLRRMLSIDGVGLLIFDASGTLIDANDAFLRMTGYSRAEIDARALSWRTMTAPESVLESEQQMGLLSKRGRIGPCEKECLRKDRSRAWILFAGASLGDGTLVVYCLDVSDRKRAEAARQESEERLRVALSAGDMGTWRYRIATDEQVLDESMGRLVGLSPTGAAMPLEVFLEVVHEADRARVREAFERCLRDGGELDAEFRVTWPDGSLHWLKDRGRAVSAPDGQPLFLTGAAVDITERKRLEEALREADRRKDAFLATLGHELRNPLAPIRNACAILELAGGSDPTVAAARELIDRQVSHLVRLVDDLLDVSRITRGKLQLRREGVGLAGVLERALEVARPLIEAAGQQLSVTLPPAPLALEADPVRLAQVFANLLNNASKYTPTGGAIQLTASQRDGEVVVEVTDNGIGIPAEHLSRLFELFHQVPTDPGRAQSGLGVGLALVEGLVTMHGGRVTAHSDGLGTGSRFRVHLPVGSAHPVAPAPPAPLPPHQGPLAGRVLVVDDQVAVAESLALLLRLHGIDVQTAADGLEALAVAERFRPDLVLLDLGMPKLDGFETCRQLRATPGGDALDIVAVTGWVQADDRARSAAAGLDAHWIKPIEPGTVLERLASIRARHPRARRQRNAT